jgi:hypothetical protein
MDWGDYLRDEAAKYRNLPKRLKTQSSSKSFSIWQQL